MPTPPEPWPAGAEAQRANAMDSLHQAELHMANCRHYRVVNPMARDTALWDAIRCLIATRRAMDLAAKHTPPTTGRWPQVAREVRDGVAAATTDLITMLENVRDKFAGHGPEAENDLARAMATAEELMSELERVGQ